MPRVRYYTMGLNKWQTSDTWPPRRAADDALPVERRQGEHVERRRRAGAKRRRDGTPDRFEYDPMNPVPSYGGNVCCTGNAITAGAFDQRKNESRAGRPRLQLGAAEGRHRSEWSNQVTLYVSSDAKDTDFTVKLIDVYPDGRAYNLDETIQRMRYRDGYDKPNVWMQSGKVYKVTLAAADHEQLLRSRTSHSHRSVEQQLPAFRSQPQHRGGKFR